MKPLKLSLPLSLLALALDYSSAYALDMEFYTYGGFNAVCLAFEKVALIFSDNGYKSLFFLTATAGVMFSLVSVYYNIFKGGKHSPLHWFIPLSVGAALYAGFITPKGNITVYDPNMNQFKTIGNIPDGLVLISCTLNKIERGFADIVDSSASVQSYQSSAGGLGFNLLDIATKGGFGLGDTYLAQSLRQYTKDCLLFELMNPNASITVADITTKSTDFVNEFKTAANPAIYTTYYTSVTPQGVTMSCKDSWDAIYVFLSGAANFSEVVNQVCSGAGFNVKNQIEVARCRSLLQDFTDYLYSGGVSISPEFMMRQIGMAEALDTVLKSENQDLALQAISNRNLMTSGISMGVVANQWLPIMKAVFTAVAISMVPIFCLFIPTGFIGKATSYIAGFFVWLACWGVIDSILHGIANDYAFNTLEYIRNNNLGYNSIMLFPSYMEGAMAAFGFARTCGIMLATVMASMVVPLGGHAMAMLSGSIAGQVQSSAASAGLIAATPEGGAQALEGWRSSVATMDNAHKYDFRRDAAARAALKMGQTGGTIEAMTRYGGKDAFSEDMASVRALSHDREVANLHKQVDLENTSGMSRRQAAESQEALKFDHFDSKTKTVRRGAQADGEFIDISSVAISRTKDGRGIRTEKDPAGETIRSAAGDTITDTQGNIVAGSMKNIAVDKLMSDSSNITKEASRGLSENVSKLIHSSRNLTWGKSKTVNDQFLSEYSETQNRELRKAIANDQSLANTKSTKDDTTFAAWIKGSAKTPSLLTANAEFGGSFTMQRQYSDGSTDSFTISTADSEAFSKAFRAADTNTSSIILSTNQGMQLAKSFTTSHGMTETNALLERASTSQTIADNVRDQTAVARMQKQWIQDKYGKDTLGMEVGMRRQVIGEAQYAINDMVLLNNPRLQDLIQKSQRESSLGNDIRRTTGENLGGLEENFNKKNLEIGKPFEGLGKEVDQKVKGSRSISEATGKLRNKEDIKEGFDSRYKVRQKYMDSSAKDIEKAHDGTDTTYF